MQQIESLESVIPAPSGEDKELLAAFIEWAGIVEEMDRLERERREQGVRHGDAVWNPLCERQADLEDRMMAMEPKTWKGVWCFFRLAWHLRRDTAYAPDWAPDAPRTIDDFEPADAFLMTGLYHATGLLLDRGRS